MTPVEPPKNAMGRNTAESTIAIATSAMVICSMDLIVACRGVRVGSSSIRRFTFSTTTIASSTNSPIARQSPNSVNVLME